MGNDGVGGLLSVQINIGMKAKGNERRIRVETGRSLSRHFELLVGRVKVCALALEVAGAASPLPALNHFQDALYTRWPGRRRLRAVDDRQNCTHPNVLQSVEMVVFIARNGRVRVDCAQCALLKQLERCDGQ